MSKQNEVIPRNRSKPSNVSLPPKPVDKKSKPKK